VKASQELGIPVPDKMIPIKDKGHFRPNTPPIVDNTGRYKGGGTDFVNDNRVPLEDILPAIHF